MNTPVYSIELKKSGVTGWRIPDISLASSWIKFAYPAGLNKDI
jgi:hypothetical protein